jgi:predicted unusual protein kinase regulating ubiquinone biosynthesis (AarF/ABC1/UbiB family)
VSDLPRKAVTRTAKLAALPLGIAGRATLGLGKRLGGRPAEEIALELQQRTADQLFRVLGELKGGAMKFGQALSVFEAALPEEVAGPYRAALTKLQEAAPPMPAATVHTALSQRMGPHWRELFLEFEDKPAAAASIGQVHRARWHDGREVAVKIQYPGAGDALLSDLTQLSRVVRLIGPLVPGLDVKPLVAELRERVSEELDYVLEARSQHAHAAEFAGDPDIVVPDVVAQADQVLVTEWLDGIPLAEVIAGGEQEVRDRAAQLLTRFLFAGPARTGLLHADPHPGNFRLLPDDGPVSGWRLGVLDFGTVDRLPEGLPLPIGTALRLALEGDAGAVLEMLRQEGFVKPSIDLDPDAVLDYLLPIIEPAAVEEFTFTRAWMRAQAARIADPRSPAYALGRQLNLPPAYLLIHRVTLSTIGVLSQLDATAPFRAELLEWLPGFAEEDAGADAAEEPAEDDAAEPAAELSGTQPATGSGKAVTAAAPRLTAGQRSLQERGGQGPAGPEGGLLGLPPQPLGGQHPMGLPLRLHFSVDVLHSRTCQGFWHEIQGPAPVLGICGAVGLGGGIHGCLLAGSVDAAHASDGPDGEVGAAHARTSLLRGRPRGRFRGTTTPCTNSSPPQTPHGSRRSTAPWRQASRTGQVVHRDLAYSTSAGVSAKKTSGS